MTPKKPPCFLHPPPLALVFCYATFQPHQFKGVHPAGRHDRFLLTVPLTFFSCFLDGKLRFPSHCLPFPPFNRCTALSFDYSPHSVSAWTFSVLQLQTPFFFSIRPLRAFPNHGTSACASFATGSRRFHFVLPFPCLTPLLAYNLSCGFFLQHEPCLLPPAKDHLPRAFSLLSHPISTISNTKFFPVLEVISSLRLLPLAGRTLLLDLVTDYNHLPIQAFLSPRLGI